MQSAPPANTDLSILFDICKLLATALLSALLSGFWLRHWQYREDFIESRLSDLVREVDNAADLGSSYWAKDRAEMESEESVRAAELMAIPLRLGALRSVVGDFFDPATCIELLTREGRFIRALTGGEFGATDRQKSPDRLRDIRTEAAHYINGLRSARRGRLDQSLFARLRH
jgi:hypothetical protein